jgi:hypothetical protein
MTITRPYARAYWTDERNPYIEPHVEGIDRALKKIETVYQGRGIMGRTQWMVPGSGAPLNSFGNPTRAVYRQLYDSVDGFASKKKFRN